MGPTPWSHPHQLTCISRWIRLLFGREFEFDDCLRVWDVLFAENLDTTLVDMTCIAMLLRIRWQRELDPCHLSMTDIRTNCQVLVMEADYTTALTLLLRYKSPSAPYGPETLVKDAIVLCRDRSAHAGATLIMRYSGKWPTILSAQQEIPIQSLSANPSRKSRSRIQTNNQPSDSPSPARPPAELPAQQKGLESLLQGVSGGLQRRAEDWGLAKAVRGAVGEVRRNVSSLQPGIASPTSSMDIVQEPSATSEEKVEDTQILTTRIRKLEERNKALAKMLGSALDSLRSQHETSVHNTKTSERDTFNVTLAKIQFVQVYLADSEIPIPGDDPAKSNSDDQQPSPKSVALKTESDLEKEVLTQQKSEQRTENCQSPSKGVTAAKRGKTVADRGKMNVSNTETTQNSSSTLSHQPRPSLAHSSFSWMLGEDRRRSDFVSSSTVPPEERRDNRSRSRPRELFADSKDGPGRKGSKNEDGGFTMSHLRGI